MAQCKCGSFAVNDDPQLKLCDRCWQDATIADLRRRLRNVTDLTDTGSKLFREVFDYRAADEMPTVWRVVEEIRRVANGV